LLARGPDGAQLFQLTLDVQPVSAFRLCGRRSITRHHPRPFEHVLRELLLGCRARRAYRGCDAATGCRDLLVRLTLQPPVELRFAEACEGQMRVRIDEAGNRG